MESKTAAGADRRYAVALILLLVVSYALRLVLSLRGGQGFWPDESRYYSVMEAVNSGNFRTVLNTVASTADHLGFKALSVIPAYLQISFNGGYAVATTFFSLFSTASIGWIWLIARRTGAGQGEALGAALTFACSNAMFYWSRHLIPYDVALFWGLACLYFAVGPKISLGNSLLAGLFGLLTFVTYNGYWTWVALVLSGHVVFVLPNWRAALLRGGGGLLSLVGGFCLLVVLAATLKANLLDSYTQFAGTITQGDFSEGHRVIWEYLWSAESVGLFVWVLAVFGLIAAQFSGHNPARRGWLWLGGVVGIVAVLVVGSNLLETFVVYGRLVRQVIPFFALLVGYMILGFRPDMGRFRVVRIGLVLLLLFSAAWNFSKPLAQEFPNEFHRRATFEIERLRANALVDGKTPIAPDRFRFVNVGFIWPTPTTMPEYGKIRELCVGQHPLVYSPFFYEGLKRDQRERFLGADIRMRLISIEE